MLLDSHASVSSANSSPCLYLLLLPYVDTMCLILADEKVGTRGEAARSFVIKEKVASIVSSEDEFIDNDEYI